MSEKRRLLFCNVAYMRYYDSGFKEETPQNGGSYVAENKTGYEINNFHLYEDGKYYGFVEPGFSNGVQKEIHIENIDPAYQDQDKVTDVTVVFCATSPAGPVIVGWYRHAMVFRRMQQSADGVLYNILAGDGDAVLLDEADRLQKAPRANSDGFGFGQSNLWYAREDGGQVREYADGLWDFIRDFPPENNLLFRPDTPEEDAEDAYDRRTFSESGERKTISVGVRARNAEARNACLKRRGHRCLVCGFDAKEVYGDAFAGRIHVHHIVPISQRDAAYRIDPEKDLIPVCPNCHMMLHTKVDGKYLTPEELKKVIRKRYEEVEGK